MKTPMRSMPAAEPPEPERRPRRRNAILDGVARDENGVAYLLRSAMARDRSALNDLLVAASAGSTPQAHGDKNLAWPSAGVTIVAERDGVLLGAARYERLPDSTDATIAVTTAPIAGQREIGTRLVTTLASAARSNGIEHFVATLATKNAALLGVFAGAGFATTDIGVGDGIMHARFAVEPAGPDAGRSSVRAIPMWPAVDGQFGLAPAATAG